VPKLLNIFTNFKGLSDKKQNFLQRSFKNTIELDSKKFKKSEVIIKISNPRNDRLFHAFKCKYQNMQLSKHVNKDYKNISNEFVSIFNYTYKELKKAYYDLRNYFNFNNLSNILEENSKSKNHIKLEYHFIKLAKFWVSYDYHFKNISYSDHFNKTSSNKKISENENDIEKKSVYILKPETIKLIKKFILNHRYNLLNLLYHKKFKENGGINKYSIPTSEFFDIIKNSFNNSINNEKSDFKKYRIYSGHDTIIINMLIVLLQRKFIMENIIKSLDDDDYFNFFSPEFGSYIVFELYKDENGKNFVKIIYNGIELQNLRSLDSKFNYNGLIEFEKFQLILKKLINENYKKLKC